MPSGISNNKLSYAIPTHIPKSDPSKYHNLVLPAGSLSFHPPIDRVSTQRAAPLARLGEYLRVVLVDIY